MTGKPFRLFGGTLHSALVHAVTQWDIKQEARANKYRQPHNQYALSIMLQRVAEVESDVAAGASPRAAVVAGFSDRLRDHVLKAIGESRFDPETDGRGGITYRKASES